MESIELIVNDEALELSDTKLALTFQAQDLGDISEKLGSYSRSFVIPVTSKNRRLLDNAFTFQSSTKIPYSTIPAILKFNGVEIKQGNILIENDGISLNAIRLTFYTGNSTFFQKINAIQLSEVCFKETEHYWWSNNIIDAREFDTRDYFYPIISYDTDGEGISNNFDRVNTQYLLPSVKLKYLLDKIAIHLGYTIFGDALNTQYFDELFLPFSNSSFVRDTNYARRNSWETKRTTDQIFNQDGQVSGIANFQQVLLCEFDSENLPINNNDSCIGVIPINTNHKWKHCDNVKVKVTISFRWRGIPSRVSDMLLICATPTLFNGIPILNAESVTTNEVTGATYIGGYGTGNRFSLANNGTFPATPLPTYHNSVVSFEIDATAHTETYYLSMFRSDAWTIYDFTFNVQHVSNLALNEADRVIEHNKFYDIEFTRSIVNPMSILPQWSVGAFIKSIAQLFGCILIADEDNKTVEFFSFQKLYDNIGFAKDWTSKVVNINTSNWNTRGGKYAQSTFFRYTNENGIEERNAEYNLVIDDSTLPKESILVQPNYSSTLNVTKMTDLLIPQITRFNDDNKVDNSNSKQRILQVDSVGRNITYYTGAAPIISKSNCVTGYFEQLDWSNFLFNAAYRLLTSVTTQYKELTVQIMLNAVDIQQLDFRLPIYLEQFNAHFYITRISDWQLETPTKVVLLKLV